MKVAINGFGRIGRLTLRAFLESAEKYNFEIVAVNDLLEIDSAVYLLKYDSLHGRLGSDVCKISENEFSVAGQNILCLSEKSPEMLPWRKLGVDLVLECTGVFKSRTACERHLNAGARKVLISAPAENADRTVVFGVNEHTLSDADVVVSNASCTTNCLAPIVKAIHGEIGLISGFMTTVHSYTGDQRLVDTNHRDKRRARAAALSIIPTSTGAGEAIGKIFPDLEGKFCGLSVRVPTANVSLLDFTFRTARKTSADEVNGIIVRHAGGDMNGVLGYTDEPLVSSDFNHSPLSSIVDLSLTKVVDGDVAHVAAWYDNEWGFSNRLLDVAAVMLRNSAKLSAN
ncbi:MAG: type I glyceraldehyde-3-phosphate dehydrogenase [Holosporaceae bacterium]|jgi:glyceraldehyde 3-phosphate dehydrogenase|nr:type I glyceraldehyde-3-phosphate dehydrogenase [Holosporaceae bacterium]